MLGPPTAVMNGSEALCHNAPHFITVTWNRWRLSQSHHMYTHTHTDFLSGDAVAISDVPKGQGGLMNSAPHAGSALS